MIEPVRSTSLLQAPLFRGVMPTQVEGFLERFDRRAFGTGEVIVREGERGDCLYIVESGMVEVFLGPGTARDAVLSQLGPGDAFGEMALLTGEPRSAAVRAVAPTTVCLVPREEFLRLAVQFPVLLFNLSRVLVGRLSRVNRAAARVREAEVVAIVGQVPPVLGSLLATNLAAALTMMTRRRALLVDVAPDRASHLPGREDVPDLADVWTRSSRALAVPPLRFETARFKAVSLPSEGGLLRAVQPLTVAEAVTWMRKAADFVVLNLTAEHPDALHVSLSQVDRVYLLATTSQLAAASRSAVARAVLEQSEFIRARTYPVILSGEGASLVEVRRRTVDHLGLKARAILPGQVQILRDAAREPAPLVVRAPYLAFSRTVRWLARDVGRLKVGLALGAGGARGFAHVGVFRRLSELGVPHDVVTGTSMGAIIGAPAGLGMTIEQGEEVMLRLHQKFTSLMRPTLSVMTSLLSPKGVEETFRELVGDATFEELPVPFAAVAADLETARPVVLRDGPVARAIQASSAIPLIWPPVVIGNARLVDGGVLNPVPTQAARDLGADIVIGVDLSGRSVQEDVPTGPLLRRQPNIFQNLLRCHDIMMADRAAQDCLLADLVIRPRFEKLSWKEFDRAELYAAAGYAAAADATASLRRLLPWLGAETK
jgi:NTE family protein